MQAWIGTAGYSYEDWVGDFYPVDTRPEGMLRYYCRQFPIVELNYTFYRPPTRGALLKLAHKTPPGFQFLVKVPQTISHDQKPLDLPGFRFAVEGLAERGQLAGLLAQFPQAMHCTRPACDWVGTVSKELNHLRLAVEFRHRSWARPGLPAWLAEQNLDLVSVDAPAIGSLFPSGCLQSTTTVYVRLHSRNAYNWYRSGVERYDYLYNDDELGDWIGELAQRDRQGGAERALLLFNNCHRGQAAVNARRMQQLFSERAPFVDVVSPMASAVPTQGTLFE
jgi:uncharacterized protein YecE (DUF72 family)